MIKNFLLCVMFAFAVYFILTSISGLREQKKHRHLESVLDELAYDKYPDLVYMFEQKPQY